MATCRICGTSFDERRYQVVIPAGPEGFDRVDCALAGAAAPLAVEETGDREAQGRDLTAALLAPFLRRLALPAAALAATASLAAAAYVWAPGSDDPRERQRVFALGRPLELPLPEFLLGARPAAGGGERVKTRRTDAPTRVVRKKGQRAAARPLPLLASASEPAGPAPRPPSPPSSAQPAPGGPRGSHPPVRPQPPAAPSPPGGARPPQLPVPVAAPAVPAPVPVPPPPTAAAQPAPTGATRPGWGHGDANHVHTGPPGGRGDKGGGKGRRP